MRIIFNISKLLTAITKRRRRIVCLLAVSKRKTIWKSIPEEQSEVHIPPDCFGPKIQGNCTFLSSYILLWGTKFRRLKVLRREVWSWVKPIERPWYLGCARSWSMPTKDMNTNNTSMLSRRSTDFLWERGQELRRKMLPIRVDNRTDCFRDWIGSKPLLLSIRRM